MCVGVNTKKVTQSDAATAGLNLSAANDTRHTPSPAMGEGSLRGYACCPPGGGGQTVVNLSRILPERDEPREDSSRSIATS